MLLGFKAFILNHKLITSIIAVIAVVGTSVALGTTGGDEPLEMQRIVVNPVETRTLAERVTIQGDISHEELGTLNMLADGRITNLAVEDGDTVGAGQEVVAVDGRPAIAVQGATPFWRPLEEGAIGQDVMQLEQVLLDAGFNPGPVDLDFTAATREALLKYQGQWGYSVPEPETEESVTVSLGSGAGFQPGPLGTAAGLIIEEPGGLPQGLIESGEATPPPGDVANVSTTGGSGPPRAVWASSSAKTQSLPIVSVAASPQTVSEGAIARLVFTSPLVPTSNTTINFTVSGSAQAGGDYDIIGGTAILQAGRQTTEVLVQTFSDSQLEFNETVDLRIVSGSGYSVGPNSRAVITIEDNSNPTVEVRASASEVVEGSYVAFYFESDQAMLADTQVSIALAGSATNEDDYEEFDETVVKIPRGSRTGEIRLETFKDKILEGTESLTMQVLPPPGFLDGSYAVGNEFSATVDINDDFNSLPVVSVKAEDNTVDEGQMAEFVISADVAASDSFKVHYTLGGSASGRDHNGESGYVNLSGGNPDEAEVAEATVVIPIDMDGEVEGLETLELHLSADLNGKYRLGSPSMDRVEIKSQDVPEMSIRGGGRVYEGGTMSFSVSADSPVVEDTAVPYTVSGSATPGADFRSVTGVALFPAGSSSTTISIATVDDDALFQPGDMVVGEWPTRIGTVNVDEGEFVVTGTPLMNLTEDELIVRIEMTPTDRAKLDVGMNAAVELAASGETTDGTLSVLEDSPEIGEGESESYIGEVAIDGELSAVDGAGVSVEVILSETKDAVVVPVAALVGKGSEVEVRVANPEGTITRVPVETGITEGAYTEIVSGLDGTERIVVEVGSS